jgi:aerobic C4-dicarboxylate transport protein
MLVTSKGAAAVSGGSFVVFAATVTAIGVLPLEGLALLFGVYRFMSMVMAIATCNTIGGSVAKVVGRSSWGGVYRTDCEGRIQSIVWAESGGGALTDLKWNWKCQHPQTDYKSITKRP